MSYLENRGLRSFKYRMKQHLKNVLFFITDESVKTYIRVKRSDYVSECENNSLRTQLIRLDDNNTEAFFNILKIICLYIITLHIRLITQIEFETLFRISIKN